MKICLLSESKQSIGGGWSFMDNFVKACKSRNVHQIVDDWRVADVVLISSSSMVTRGLVEQVDAAGIPIFLRVDNIPRNSRNRNTGTSRLFDFAQIAQGVIYQSGWSKGYIQPFIKKDGRVIYNGVDIDIFRPEGISYDFHGSPVYIYSQYNRDETKQFHKAWYYYQMIQRQNPAAKLILVGQFSPEQVEYNFDFFMGEKYEYRDIADNPEEMAKIFRGAKILLAPYFNDCYSNTIQEAMACGLKVDTLGEWSGGTPELLENKVKSHLEMFDEYVNYFRSFLAHE